MIPLKFDSSVASVRVQTKNLLGPCSLSPQLSHPSFTSGLLRQPFQWQSVNSDVALTVDNVFLSAYVVLIVSCELLEFALASATAIINLRDKKKKQTEQKVVS